MRALSILSIGLALALLAVSAYVLSADHAPSDGTTSRLLPAASTVQSPVATTANGADPASGETAPDRVPAAASGLGAGGPVAEAAAVHGTVRGPDGRPVGGARIAAEAAEAEEYSLLDPAPRTRVLIGAAVSGADGRYRLPLPAGRACLLRAAADGFSPAFRGGCLPGSRVDFELAPAAVLTGSVRAADDGAPVPGTRIVVVRGEGFGSAVRVGAGVADASGRYRIDGLPAGAVEVRVQSEALADPRSVDVELVAGAVTVHDVALLRGTLVRGRVVDATNHVPIPGAEVHEGWNGRSTTSGADGSFVLPGVGPDTLELKARAAGYAEAAVVVRSSRAEEIASAVVIALQKGRVAIGRVVGPDGRPVADAYVAAVAAEHGDHGRFQSDWRAARTDVEGAFRLGPLRVDLRHELLLLKRGFATAVHSFPADEAERDVVDLGERRLQRPGSIAGRVVDERGLPVAAQDVVLQGHNADRWPDPAAAVDGYRAIDSYVAERRGRTDVDGRFLFSDLAPGSYHVRVLRPDSHEAVVARRDLALGEHVAGVELSLFRGASIEGSVWIADGGALPVCYCSIDPEDGQSTSGDVQVGPDGRFRATGLQPGNYRVTVYPYASEVDRAAARSFVAREHAHVAAGTAGLRCEVPVRLPVRGRVLDAVRAPVAGVPVGLLDGDDVLESMATDADGRFQLAAPFARRVVVAVCAPSPGGEPVAFDRGRVLLRTAAAAGGDPLEFVLPAR